MRLDAATIVPFIIGYLNRVSAADHLKDGRVQLKLGERILTLAESGGRKTPVTPLLVTLFVDSALRRIVDGLSFDDMPEVVPEIFVDYLRRLNSSGTGFEPVISDDVFIRAARAVASVSLGKTLVPQDFSPHDATELLKQEFNTLQSPLLNRLIPTRVLLHPPPPAT